MACARLDTTERTRHHTHTDRSAPSSTRMRGWQSRALRTRAARYQSPFRSRDIISLASSKIVRPRDRSEIVRRPPEIVARSSPPRSFVTRYGNEARLVDASSEAACIWEEDGRLAARVSIIQPCAANEPTAPCVGACAEAAPCKGGVNPGVSGNEEDTSLIPLTSAKLE